MDRTASRRQPRARFRVGDAEFDRAFFVAGDGGHDLEALVRMSAFQESIRRLFHKTQPKALQLDVDGRLTVHAGRVMRTAGELRALLFATADLVDDLQPLADAIKSQRHLVASDAAISVGGDSGAPVPVPARRS